MTWTDLRLRLRALFRRQTTERDLNDELAFHLDMAERKNREAGYDPVNASRLAARDFGGLARHAEDCRDARGTSALENLWRDLRYGVRVLGKSPVFTCVAIASLAIGIGANTAVFSMVDTVLLRTLPVSHPEELVVLGLSAEDGPPNISSSYSNTSGGGSYGRWHTNVLSWPAFENIRSSDILADAIGYSQLPRLALTTGGESRVINGLAVSGNYFRSLGVNMALGRPLRDDDDQESGNPAVVISYGLWEGAFAADPSVIGRTVYLNRAPHVVVGVAPRDFFGISVFGFFRARSVDVTLPISARERMDPVHKGSPSWRSPDMLWVQMMGRLRPGSSTRVISSQLASVFVASLPDGAAEWGRTRDARVDVTDGRHGLETGRDRFKNPFAVLSVAVTLTLMMACVNLTGLLLARSTTRTREVATRLAVGAGRGRLIRQLLTESALLAAGGSAVGLLLAWTGLRALRPVTSAGQFEIPVDVHLDVRVLAFTASVAILTTFLFGLAPALRATRVDLAGSMKENSAGSGAKRFGAIRSLVAVQIAIALLLVIGATLATRTLLNVRSIPLGFSTRNLAVFTIDAGRSGYNPSRRTALFQKLLEEFNRAPGVAVASASVEIPMSGFNSSSTMLPEGSQRRVNTRVNGISERFFDALHLPLIAGRAFTARDLSGRRVAILNQSAAVNLFGTPAALGRRFRWSRIAEQAEVEVIGIVKDAKYDRLKGDPPPTTYIPWTQTPWGEPSQLGFEILTTGNPAAALSAIRRTVRDADPMLPLIDLKTMEAQIDEAVEQERLLAAMVSLFGAITLLLACVGLYGMVSYTVASRTREIGVRMALGADRLIVLGMIVRQVAVTALAGLALGIPLAWVAVRYAESLIYGITAHDPASFALAGGLVLILTTIACAGPARRAARIDPLRALRYE